MIYTAYASAEDMTFIIEETETTIEVKGFYFGEPEDELTEKYYGDLVAEIANE